VHVTPQAPQFAGSLFGSTHALPHDVVIAAHDCAQIPAAQTWPAWQVTPQPPQLAGSDCVSGHCAPQAGRPAGHWQAPCAQTSAPEQVMPHVPQLALSASVLVQRPPHGVSPDWQCTPHEPAEQTWLWVHAWPHVPQFSGSESELTHAP
jgi:hypothetical protein